MTWSLEDELVQLSGRPTLPEALLKLGMIQSLDERFTIANIFPWRRGGAETYIFAAQITSDFSTKRFILKALVGFTPGTDPSAQLERWLSRRKLLASSNVRVPKLYASAKAMLIEEFIEDDSIERLASIQKWDNRLNLIRERLIAICSDVFSIGFRPVTLLPNIRMQEDEPVWVDFGHDLGDPVSVESIAPPVAQALEKEFGVYVGASFSDQ